MRKTLFILITALVAFGCSSDKSSVVEETAEVSATTETPMTTTEEEPVEEEPVEEEPVEEEPVEEEPDEEEETTPACDSWDADPKVTPDWPYDSGMYAGPSLQADARLGAHADYDRWVLEFSEDSTPPTGWEVFWNGDVVEVNFGEDDWDPTSEVEGSQYLMINMRATAGLGFPEDEWYDGPRDLYGSDARTENIVHAASFGTFEGYSTWAIGVDHEGLFNVFTLTEPSRLVIDICH